MDGKIVNHTFVINFEIKEFERYQIPDNTAVNKFPYLEYKRRSMLPNISLQSAFIEGP